MYGASWCSHCKDQKEMFGDSWKHIDYIECSGANACRKAGIRGYPTWEIDGNRYPGAASFEQLSSYSGCGLG
ncbi:hypothetical protein GF318_05445 [Candidatus Micrarchaeota archaeon]|nr:hypothetical protein [Candidatus Micrarchaeota archaeon]